MHDGSDRGGGLVVRIVDHDPAWAARFTELGGVLRRALGTVALRIDHIGSTSVPGLGAKPIIDVQVSVERLEPVAPFAGPLTAAGFVFRADNPERTKRYFREAPGRPRTHVHVRRAGSFSEQFPLLFRDFLRVDRESAAEYERVKRALARQFGHDRHGYTEAKAEIFWTIVRRADGWAQRTGWEPGPSDA